MRGGKSGIARDRGNPEALKDCKGARWGPTGIRFSDLRMERGSQTRNPRYAGLPRMGERAASLCGNPLQTSSNYNAHPGTGSAATRAGRGRARACSDRTWRAGLGSAPHCSRRPEENPVAGSDRTLGSAADGGEPRRYASWIAAPDSAPRSPRRVKLTDGSGRVTRFRIDIPLIDGDESVRLPSRDFAN